MFSQYASRILSPSSQQRLQTRDTEAPLFNNEGGQASDSDSEAEMGPSSQFLSSRPTSSFSVFRGGVSDKELASGSHRTPNVPHHHQAHHMDHNTTANVDSVYGPDFKRFWVSSFVGTRPAGARAGGGSNQDQRRISQVNSSAAGDSVEMDQEMQRQITDDTFDDPAFGIGSHTSSGQININESTSTAAADSLHSSTGERVNHEQFASPSISLPPSPSSTNNDNMQTVQLDDDQTTFDDLLHQPRAEREDHDAPPEDLAIERPKHHLISTTANLSVHGDSIPTTTIPINSALLDQSSIAAPAHSASQFKSHREFSRNLSSYSYYNNGDASAFLRDFGRSSTNNGPSSDGASPHHTSTYNRPALYSISSANLLYPNWSYGFWACLCLACATSAIVWLTTETPQSTAPALPKKGMKTPKIISDSIYDLLRSSSVILFEDTIIALGLAALWLFCMRKFSQISLLGLIIVVPIILFTMGMYAMVMSYRSAYGGYTGGDKFLRCVAWILILGSIAWSTLMYYSRARLDSALGVVRRACAVVNENIQLLVVTMTAIGLMILVTFVWTGMFRLLFLEGRLIRGHWIIDSRVWIVSVLYILLYLWTCGAISCAQRCIIAGITAHWVFYNDSHVRPNPFRHLSGKSLVKVHVHRCINYQMGLVCYSSFITLLTRVPMAIAPNRISKLLERGLRVSSTLTLISSPITLTMASICNSPLDEVCDRLSRSPLPRTNTIASEYQGTNTAPTMGSGTTSAFTYNLAKLLLTSSRATMAIIFAIGAWVHASMYYKYAYILGFIAGAIGWVVLGAMESTLGATLDALYVCENLYNRG